MEQIQAFAEQNLVPYAVSFLWALLIFIVGRMLASRLSNLARGVMDKKLDPTISQFVARLLHVVLLVFVIIAALDQLGVQTTSIIALFGAATLAVGFAMKDSLSNFAAGVMLIVYRPFRVGDFVDAGGVMGTVQEVRIFATLMTTPDNKEIIVPNSAILGGNITNFSAKSTRRVDMVFGVSYDADLSKVKNVLQDILSKDERILPEPAPVIAVSELADSSVNLIVRPWVNSADYWKVFWDTTEAVKTRFDQEGISIPFPQMDVHLDKTGDD